MREITQQQTQYRTVDLDLQKQKPFMYVIHKQLKQLKQLHKSCVKNKKIIQKDKSQLLVFITNQIILI